MKIQKQEFRMLLDQVKIDTMTMYSEIVRISGAQCDTRYDNKFIWDFRDLGLDGSGYHIELTEIDDGLELVVYETFLDEVETKGFDTISTDQIATILGYATMHLVKIVFN
jgi:hypothetical protein